MKNLRANIQIHSRRYAAASLILTSILAAMVITDQSNRTVQVWSAKRALAAGDRIRASDIQPSKVLLPENSTKYLSTRAVVVNTYATRWIGSGELIPATALSVTTDVARLRGVPIAVNRNDLPADLVEGENVDIYSLPIKNQSSSVGAVIEIAHGVDVASIDNASKSLGGAIGVVVKLSDDSILTLLTAEASNRIVIVRHGA